MVQQIKVIKKDSSNDDYGKDTSLLIDLDGLDDWNKSNPKNQDLLKLDYNQWGQNWYQTEANKAKNNTCNMKVNNIESPIIYNLSKYLRLLSF